jgi:transcriptional regulator with XRE-family HTH domain
MLLSDLQDVLRKTTLKSVHDGCTTGSTLARKTGFKHAHVTNFMYGRRNLSVEGFDKFLRALDLSVKDLISNPGPRKNKSRRKR